MPIAIAAETMPGMYHGLAVVQSTAVRLTDLTTITAKKGILIRNLDGTMIVSDDNDKGNSGPIFIGFSRSVLAIEYPVTEDMVKSAGMPLGPGESITIPVRNPNDIWIISTFDTDQYIAWATV